MSILCATSSAGVVGASAPLSDSHTLLRLLCALCPRLDSACTPGFAGSTEADARAAAASVQVSQCPV